MRRFFHLMIVAIVALTACCACSKVNDIDKRLGVLENIVSDLKAQISAGAVITSVDKTSDGCTFTLSNGQTYTVTNGKDGTDGEAIIADVKIEENFVVLTLKNGETLRISYQNPLSIVTLTIVPDYTDGTVKNYSPVTNCMFLSIEVTPSKYAEILADTSRFIHKVVFSPVKKTKADFGDAFTITPSSILYNAGAPIPFLELCLELDEMSVWMLDNGTYAVSCTIEDKEGVNGVSTAFVPISYEKGSGEGGGQTDNAVPAGALPGKFTVNAQGKQVYFSRGNLYYDETNWGFEEEQYYFRTYEGQGKYDANGYNQFSGTASGSWGLFGWSTEGKNFGMSTSTSDNDYSGNFLDWGTRIDDKGTWTTLSGGENGEWKYLFDHHVHMWGTCNGLPGQFIAPDDFKGDAAALSTAVSDWETAQAAGIVFLPAASRRVGSEVCGGSIGEYGNYWSSTAYEYSPYFAYFADYAYFVYFESDDVDTDFISFRDQGYSVRLVTESK